MRRLALFGCALAIALLGAGTPVAAKGSLSGLEDEFEKAIKKVTPATVVCLARGVEERKVRALPGSSGVIMSKKGLVLSDGDVGIYNDKPASKSFDPSHLKRTDEIEVRLPSLKGKGFQSFKARVIRRDRDLDTSLLRIEKPPSTLKYLVAGSSDEVKVGDYSFVMGNSFGLADEAPPTLTAGVIASLVPKATTNGGKWEHIYTSAAVNRGVNGGPIVNTRGQLIGTISNVVGFRGKKPDDPELKYAFLGKCVPIDRLRDFYKDLDEFQELFPESKRKIKLPTESTALSMVFNQTSKRTYDSLVSLEIEREEQLSTMEPARGGGMVKVPRYLGPVSGTLISGDGWILSSLYNFANIATLNPRFAGRWKAPDNAKIAAGIEGIKGIEAHLPDGRKVEARFVAFHEGIGLVLIKADMKLEGEKRDPASTTVATLRLVKPAPKTAFKEGRFVLAVGNPFGSKRLDDPLLTVGMLSKRHHETTEAPWAGQWQTDAGGTDANAGGAAVDLEGNLLGIMTIWSSTSHGRNSGIAFIVPWQDQIEPVLEEMKTGRSYRRPLMGVTWKDEDGTPTTQLLKVAEDSAADDAGLEPGDIIVKIDGQIVTDITDVKKALAGKWSGDKVVVVVDRDGVEKTFELTLGARE